MNKAYYDKEKAKLFIQKHFKNCKNYSERKLIFYYRILIKIIPNVNNIPDTAFVDIFKFEKEIGDLSSTYQKMLSLRYGEKDDICHTFANISEILYISNSRLSKIHITIIKKLKKYISNFYFPFILIKHTDTNSTPIKELNLDPKTRNVLLRAGIYTIEELIQYSNENLPLIFGVGKKRCKEIITSLNEYNNKNKA